MKIRTIAACCLTLGLAGSALAGCSWLQEDDAATAAAAPKLKLWTTKGLTPFSPVKAVDGVGVALATQDRRVYVVGLEPSSGRVLWRRETTPSSIPRGISVDFAAAGAQVALLSRPEDRSYRARLHIVSARTGATVAYSSLERFVRYPEVCEDEPKAFCAQVIRGREGREAVQPVRLRPDAARLVLDPRPDSAWVQSIGEGGLSVLWKEGDQRVVRVRKARTVWSQKVSSFDPRADLAHGWNFALDQPTNRYVGSTGLRPTARAKKQRTYDLADSFTVGLEASSGRRIWLDRGSDYSCNSLVTPIELSDDRHSYLRCRSRGTLTYRKGQGEPAITKLNVTLERFDPTDGTTLWKADLGPARGLVRRTEKNARFLLDDRRQAFRSGSKVVTVDLVDGTRRPTPPTTVAWCLSDTQLNDPLGGTYENGEPWTVMGDDVAYPCDLTGKPTSAVPTSWPKAVTASFANGVTLVSTPEAFVGYGAEKTPTASTAPTTGASTVVWESKGVEPFSPVTDVDGVAVAVVRQGRRLFTAGFDPASGKRLWRHELGLASVERDWGPYVMAVGKRAGFYTPAGKSTNRARFTLVDPHTGTVVGRSAPGPFLGYPASCVDGTGDVCTYTAKRPHDWQNPGYQAWRFSPVDARLRLDRPRTARMRLGGAGYAAGLFTTRTKVLSEDIVGVAERGKVLWKAPMRRVSRVGGYFGTALYDPASDVLVLSPSRLDDDVSHAESVGVRRSDGKVLWRAKGSETDCAAQTATSPYLVPGGSLPSLPLTASKAPVASVFLRCRFHGRWVSQGGLGGSKLVGGRATVERFDPATGKTLWAVDLGRGTGVLPGSEDSKAWITRIVDDAHLAFGTGADHLVVDVRTGKVEVAEASQPAWCWETRKVAYRSTLKGRFATTGTVTSRLLLHRCTVDGKPSDVPAGQIPISVSTAFPGGLRLVATASGFVAYR